MKRRYLCEGIGSSDDTQISANRWSNGYKTWRPIYVASPGYLKLAGVQGSLIHTQEPLQTIQELSVHILSP